MIPQLKRIMVGSGDSKVVLEWFHDSLEKVHEFSGVHCWYREWSRYNIWVVPGGCIVCWTDTILKWGVPGWYDGVKWPESVPFILIDSFF